MPTLNWKDRRDQEWIDREGQEWMARLESIARKNCADVTENSDLLEGKPRESEILKTLIDEINILIQEDLINASCDIETQSSILTATGIWLDYIGERFLYPRPQIIALDQDFFGFDGNGKGFDQAIFVKADGPETEGIEDEIYRSLLIVRGGQLLTDCSIPSMNAIILAAFESGSYIDNGNMTLDVIIDDSQPDPVIEAIVESGLITKPAGVGIGTIEISHGAENTFGFDGHGLGFDQGLFVRTIDDLS